ncbi:D-Ala-teichoic acid biosynthesis protein [Enterococcus sp. JM4C]|nr:teichoic acid D-Ala incorporation-associated protein DltX [Enterococcus sp. JM4C]KAF1298147.1 D-Ala-teichoic acid biosynthesis protein [Enterococcus sp. JM4C]
MKQLIKNEAIRNSLIFIGKTAFYFCIILLLIYLYHYKNIQGGTFIYNEF